MATLRGRAAQLLRPGIITKAILSGDIPLTTGELVKEAAITDIHGVYRYLTVQENIVRKKEKRFRGMTYRSFATLFRFAYLLGLVERVREEPMLFPPAKGKLLSIRMEAGEPRVVESKRVIYRLTQIGLEDEVAWTNLCKAWIENWPVPQKALEEVPTKYVPPPIVEVPPPPVEEVPVTKPTKIPKIPKFSESPSVAQFRKLLSYLKSLRDSGADAKIIRKQLYDVSGVTADWAVWIEDAFEAAKEAGQKSKIEKFNRWSKYIEETTEAFIDEDLPRIIEILERLV